MDIEKNYNLWNTSYDWDKQPTWIKPTVKTDIFWRFVLFPRMSSLMPSGSFLELAPGHGRWTEFLHRYCQKLHLVDLSPKCIDYCRSRFEQYDHLEYWVNDGLSLSFIEEQSVDFAFSFDSLVHCDAYIMESYIKELGRVLKKDGIAFIHHSNVGLYTSILEGPDSAEKQYLIEDGRAFDVDHVCIEKYASENGLFCVTQELLPWGNGSQLFKDCITTLVGNESKFKRENVIIENLDFINVRKKLNSTLMGYSHVKE